MVSKTSKNFMGYFSVAGRLCILAAFVGFLLANFGPTTWYAMIRTTQWSLTAGTLLVSRAGLDWINLLTGTLLAFVTGMEIKRMLLDGELTGPDRLRLPLMAMLGVLLSPLAMLALASDGSPVLWWLTVAGLDMAFALAVLGFFGERVPDVLKGFVCTTALFVVAVCVLLGAGWTVQIPEVSSLILPAVCVLMLLVLNRMGVMAVSLYLVPAGAMWLCLLSQPLPAMAVALLTAVFIPFHNEEGTRSPLMDLEQDLLPLLCFVLLPLSVLVNAGFPLTGPGAAVAHDLRYTAAVLCLFPGKAAAVLAVCALGVRLGLCALPPGVDWKELGGACLLCSVGFALNYQFGGVLLSGEELRESLRLIIAVASVLSLVCGSIWLRYALSRRRNKVIART